MLSNEHDKYVILFDLGFNTKTINIIAESHKDAQQKAVKRYKIEKDQVISSKCLMSNEIVYNLLLDSDLFDDYN